MVIGWRNRRLTWVLLEVFIGGGLNRGGPIVEEEAYSWFCYCANECWGS